MFAPNGLTPPVAFFLVWVSLLVLLPLLRAGLRHPALLLALPLLGATVLTMAMMGPLRALSEQLFAFRAGDTLALTEPLPARSIYIPERQMLETPLYDCFGNWPGDFCALPIVDWFADGRVDMVEFGTDPVQRLTLGIHRMDCAGIDTLRRTVLSSGLGICLVAEEVPAPEAALQLDVTPGRMPFPSGKPYWRLTLTDRATGTVLARRDHWIVPYERRVDNLVLPEPTGSPRQPDDTLAALLAIEFGTGSYDTVRADALMARHGLNFDVLLRAASTGPQALRAQAMHLACRNSVVAVLNAEQRQALRDASADIFAGEDWRYPESCHPSLR